MTFLKHYKQFKTNRLFRKSLNRCAVAASDRGFLYKKKIISIFRPQGFKFTSMRTGTTTQMDFMKRKRTKATGGKAGILLIILVNILLPARISGQSYLTVSPDTAVTHQTMVGFGGSLAFYEGWVTAHPNKSGIYEAIFGELSLDILRVRNAHEYLPGMINTVSEFVQAAEASLGAPISVLSTSWGPPGRLKSNNDRSNGGTLRYTVSEGNVEFDYAGFASWWQSSLDEYNASGIYPEYISIQNEPDWTADYESCRLNPSETVNSSDTIAGYNKALQAVHDSVQTRDHVPMLLGPETIGIGYNAVENYCNQMDLSLVAGIAHHLYHGVDEDQPFESTLYQKVADYRPDIPHFQTEYSRGNWWSVGGLIHKSLCDEDAVAYLYWDLAWDGGGLVALDFPWDRDRWSNSVGYTRTKDFYAFKQFSAFIHPGWERISTPVSDDSVAVSFFMSPDKDSAAMVIINRYSAKHLMCNLNVPGYTIERADLYATSGSQNCTFLGDKKDQILDIGPLSIATVSMGLSDISIEIPVASVELSPADDSITNRLDSMQIEATILPLDASATTLFWEITSGNSLAQVTQDGLLKAKGNGNGEVVVRASTTDGSGIFADTTIVLVNQLLVTDIDLSGNPDLLDLPMGTLQLSATVMPKDAYNKTLSWEITAGAGIATITQEGLVLANGTADGNVEVRAAATDGSGVMASITIEITNQVAVDGVTITPAEATIDTLMGSVRLEAIVTPENASIKSVDWSILSGSELAMIDPVGRVISKGKGDGDVTIRATSESNPEIFADAVVHITNQTDGAKSETILQAWGWYANGHIHCRIQPKGAARRLHVYSITGKVISQVEIPPYDGHVRVDVSNMQAALFIVVIETPGMPGIYFKVSAE